MINEKRILENIVVIRKELGYSQEYLASKLGMAQPGYALIERGERGLTVSRLLQIANIFNISVIDILLHNVEHDSIKENRSEIKASLTIELNADKKDQVLRLVFGDNNLEILNK